jgi:hypothetical protein
LDWRNLKKTTPDCFSIGREKLGCEEVFEHFATSDEAGCVYTHSIFFTQRSPVLGYQHESQVVSV